MEIVGVTASCGYTDADYAGCIDTRKSTSGFVFLFNGGAISWASQKQRVIALFTTEAEYIALAMGTKDAIWLRRIISELGFKFNRDYSQIDYLHTFPMYVHNQLRLSHQATRNIIREQNISTCAIILFGMYVNVAT